MAGLDTNNVPSTPGQAIGSRSLTNRREAVAYFLLRLVNIAGPLALIVTGTGDVLFGGVMGSGASGLVFWGLMLLWQAVTLVLFLALRGVFGGTPTAIVGHAGRAHAIATRWFELGAYVLAEVVGSALIAILSALVLVVTYPFRQGDGSLESGAVFAIADAVAGAIVTFLLFIALRRVLAARWGRSAGG